MFVKLLLDNRTTTAENNYFIPYESTDSGLSKQDWISLLSTAGFFNLSSRSPQEYLPFNVENMLPGDSCHQMYMIDVKDQNAVELKLDLELTASSEPLAKALNVRLFVITDKDMKNMSDASLTAPFYEGTFYALAKMDPPPAYTLSSNTANTIYFAFWVEFPAETGNENADGESLHGKKVISHFEVAVSAEKTPVGPGGTTVLDSSSVSETSESIAPETTTTVTTTSATTTQEPITETTTSATTTEKPITVTTTSVTTTQEPITETTTSVTVTVEPGTSTSKPEPTTSETVTVEPGTSTAKPEPTTSETVTVVPGTTTSKPEPTTSETVTVDPGTETTTEPTSSVTVTTEPVGSETTTEITTTEPTEDNDCHANIPWCVTGIGGIDLCPWCWLLPLITIIGAALIVSYYIIKMKGGM